MSNGEETSNAGFAYSRVPRPQIGDRRNPAFVANVDSNGGCGSSPGTCDFVRTYKRRKKMANCSSECFFERESLDRLPRQYSQSTMKRGGAHSSKIEPMNRSIHDSTRKCRTSVLKQMYESLKADDDGIKGCIKDALMMAESESCDRISSEDSSQSSRVVKENNLLAKNVICKGETVAEGHSVSEILQRAFFKIILSEKFTLLCKLVFDNFEGVKFEKFMGLSVLDRRMRDGAYEQSPMLFSSDVQQLWLEIQKIGNELITISSGLLDLSKRSLNEQMDFLGRSSIIDPKRKTCNSFGAPIQAEGRAVHQIPACRHCGGKADTRDCLVCDSCEQIYHVNCIEPVIEDIPSSWYCISCRASIFGAESHENCVVCERLTLSKSQLKTGCFPGDEENDSEETSNESNDEKLRQTLRSATYVCKFCGIAVDDADKIKICEHQSCPYKCFHARCLTRKQLKSYGPSWYCPSCLCRTCLTDKDDHKIVLCDCCDNAYHIYCLTPPWTTIPRGKWLCRQCKVKLRIIKKARRAYEELELKNKLEGAQKGRGGMDVLLSAALNCDVHCPRKS